MSSTMPKSHFWEVAIRTECLTSSMNFFPAASVYIYQYWISSAPLFPSHSVSFSKVHLGVSHVAFFIPVTLLFEGWVVFPGYRTKDHCGSCRKKLPKEKYAKFSAPNIQKLGNSRIKNPSYHWMTQCFTSHLPLQCTLAIVYSPHSTLSIEVF